MILAIDQGTTGTTCLVVDDELRPRGRGYREFPQHYPHPGWVEHDPEELWAFRARRRRGCGPGRRLSSPSELEAIGIANQRETTILWQRATGRPVAPAIVWQDRRTAERCRELPAELLRARTGLVPDPYFSATKLEWLLARTDVPRSELAFGTVDSWLVWKLTGGRVHATDLTNASRTMLLDLDSLDWDDELLDLFDVDRALLPRLVRSSEVVGEAELLGVDGAGRGHRGRPAGGPLRPRLLRPGRGEGDVRHRQLRARERGSRAWTGAAGLLETVAASGGYALEGAILASGAAIQWLRDGLGILADAAESERLARTVESTGGVSFVPAFAGLGSPHWNADARGLISGITRGTTRAHLVRAALEGIAFQVADVLDVLPGGVDVLRADGGASANGFLMQFQADLLGCPVEVAAEQETTALGAAALAGRAIGLWPDDDAIRTRLRPRCGLRAGGRPGRASPPGGRSGGRRSSARSSELPRRHFRMRSGSRKPFEQVEQLGDRNARGEAPQQVCEPGIELIRALRVVEGAPETCARQALELLRRVAVLLGEALERGTAREGEDDLLPRDAELAGGAVERRQDDLLGDLLEALRVAPFARRARIGDGGGRVGRSAEREIDADERNGCRRWRGRSRASDGQVPSTEQDRDEGEQGEEGGGEKGAREGVRDGSVELVLQRRTRARRRPGRRGRRPPRRPRECVPPPSPRRPRPGRCARPRASRAAECGCRARPTSRRRARRPRCAPDPR